MATKIELKQLYKEDIKTLEPLKDKILRAHNTRAVTGFNRNDLQTVKTVHDRYYSSDPARLSSCGKCILKMLDRVATMLKKEE